MDFFKKKLFLSSYNTLVKIAHELYYTRISLHNKLFYNLLYFILTSDINNNLYKIII